MGTPNKALQSTDLAVTALAGQAPRHPDPPTELGRSVSKNMKLVFLSFIILFGIFVFGKTKYKNAMGGLNLSQKENALMINQTAKKGHSAIGYFLLVLLIIGLFFYNELDRLFFLIFFSYGLISSVIYHFRSKNLLASSGLPRNFITEVLKTDRFYIFAYFFVVLAFGVSLI